MPTAPPEHTSDPFRLATLAALDVLDTPPEPVFDDIVAIACLLCDTPVALVSLVAEDRQWFKARIGFEPCETSLDKSVCAHALGMTSLLVIDDLTADARTRDNPLVTRAPHLRFYAGAPLIAANGAVLGTLCVIDRVPRPGGLSKGQADGLAALARQVVTALALRTALHRREGALAIARSASHDQLRRAEASEAAGARLRAVERRLRTAQEAARVGSFEVDLATDRAILSAEFCRIFGIAETGEAPMRDLTDRVLPQDRALATSPVTRADGTAATDATYRIRRLTDGAVRWISRRSAFERDETGRPVRLLGIVQDITEQTRADLRQRALLALGDGLREAASTAAAIACATAILGETLDVERAGYARVDRRVGLLAVEHDWTADGVASLKGSHAVDHFKRTIDTLADRKVLAVDDVRAAAGLGPDLAYYARIGAAAHITAPSFRRGELASALFVHAAHPRLWTEPEVDFMTTVADQTDATVARLASEAGQHLLNEELSHRLKNTLTMVQAIAKQTLKGSENEAAVAAFSRRLIALSKAHDILLSRHVAAARMHAVVGGVLQLNGDLSRFGIDGPDLILAPNSVLSLSLLLHELVTNALKYGALSTEAGRVVVAWTVEDAAAGATLTLRWQETGGPAVIEPVRRGFGSRLIQHGLVGAGEARLRYDREGLEAVFRAPLSAVVGE